MQFMYTEHVFKAIECKRIRLGNGLSDTNGRDVRWYQMGQTWEFKEFCTCRADGNNGGGFIILIRSIFCLTGPVQGATVRCNKTQIHLNHTFDPFQSLFRRAFYHPDEPLWTLLKHRGKQKCKAASNKLHWTVSPSPVQRKLEEQHSATLANAKCLTHYSHHSYAFCGCCCCLPLFLHLFRECIHESTDER